VITVLVSFLFVSAQEITSISIYTPEWEGYSDKDGTGLYHELWKKVFEAEGIALNITYAPYIRCEAMAAEGHPDIDAYPGAYDGMENLIIPEWHIGIDILSVAYKTGTIPSWTDQSVLEGKVVSWERGFYFDNYGIITANVQLHEFDDKTNAMQMLVNDRLDYIVDYSDELIEIAEELSISDKIVVADDVIAGPKYYFSFVNNEKGKKLAEIWDAGMAKLSASGELVKIFEKYGETGVHE